jgi:transposase
LNDLLGLEGLRALRVDESDGECVIEAEGTEVPTACPDCGPVLGRLYGHGSQTQSFRDTPMHGMPTRLAIRRRRFQCQHCHKTLFEPLVAMDDKRLVTRRLLGHVRRQVFSETFASLARQAGLDEKTIRNICEDFVAELRTEVRFRTPRVLGIDELKIVGAYRAVITNIEKRCLFDMLTTRSKNDLLGYFQALPDKAQIEWVTMDMYHVYRDVARQTLPNARIVVDRFHIERMANEVIEQIRKRFRKELPDKERLKLKDERFLLLKRQRDLKPEQFERLRAWFDKFPLLSEAHALKEGFMAIWDESKTRAEAEQAWLKWQANVSPELRSNFKALITAMTNWHDEILNYFESSMTNAYTESSNNLTRAANRMGRGYSFEVIRARMLYNNIARKHGADVLQKPVPAEPTAGYMVTKSLPAPRVRYIQEVVEYGAHIPTLAKLADEGFFD